MSMEDMQATMGRMIESSMRAFGAPELVTARASACPHQMYADLMATSPVRDLGDGYYSLLTMNDILFATRHPDIEQGSKYLGSDRPAIPLGLDGELHRQYRRLLDPIFTAKQMAPLATKVRELANSIIDTFITKGTVNVYEMWCEPLPSTIFLSIMGLPLSDLEDFIHFKNLTLSSGDFGMTPEQRMASRMEAAMWMHAYFDNALTEREGEAHVRDDVIGLLQSAEVDGHKLSRQDVQDILGLFMIAGLDTVSASLACFLSHFARTPRNVKRSWPTAHCYGRRSRSSCVSNRQW